MQRPHPHHHPPGADGPDGPFPPPFYPPPPVDYPPPHHHRPHHPQFPSPPHHFNPHFPNPNFQFHGPDPQFHGHHPHFPDPNPQFHGLHPEFEGPDPQFQGHNPQFHGFNHEFQGPNPLFRGHHPQFEGPDPQFEGHSPQFNGPNPQFHGSHPEFQGPHPQFHGPRPEFQGPDPQFRDPNPRFQSHNPQSQGPNPHLEQVAPPIQHPHKVASSTSVDGLPTPNSPNTTTVKNLDHQDKKRKLADESQQQQVKPPPSREESLQQIEVAVEQVRRELVAFSENVSTWKVSQSALAKLQAVSWDSLSFQLHEVPSLHRLIFTEAKINAFIHCFVAVRTITSVYDLEVAICENEDIKKFEELELGPLLRHPLIELYFSSKGMNEIYKITGRQIIDYLKKFIVKLKGKPVDGNNFLDYIADKCKVSSWERIGVRIQGLGKHVGFIREALRLETSLHKMCFQKGKSPGKKSRKQLLLTLEKEQMDKAYNVITQPDPLTATCVLKESENDEPVKKKRKLEKQSCTAKDGLDDALANDSIRMFITTWKETCCQLTATEVFEEMMQFYDLSPKHKNRVKKLFSMYPFLGLLNVAIISIKNGSWDSIYEMIQSLDKPGCRHMQSQLKKCIQYECLDVGSSGKNLPGSTNLLSKSGLLVTVEDIMKKVREYFAGELLHCEAWLNKKYCVKEFGDLGFGDYLTFLERHLSLVPKELHDNVNGQVHDQLSLETKPMLSPILVTIEDIMKNVREYFAGKLLHCDAWLSKQFFVKEFGDLGYGDYLTFLERYISLLPQELNDNLHGQVHKQLSFETEPMLSPISVTIEDIMKKVREFFARRLIHCEVWLKEQYCVKEFGDLGYGDYLTFLERHISLLPEGLHDNVNGQVHNQFSFKTKPMLSPILLTVEDIMKKVREYFAGELLHCEAWLSKQYCIKEFNDLGYGDYLRFLERHISLVPKELHDNLNGQVHDQFSFEVNLLKQQLIVLLSQASDSLWVDGIITKQRIASLLSLQYPFINFSVVEKGCLDNILQSIKEHKSSSASNCLLFSSTLLETYDSGDTELNIAKDSLDCTGLEAETCRKVGNAGSFTTKDAVDILLKAPMLVDLNSWLHWDIVYAPSLGPLLTWLLTEVNAKDLLCLLPRDGKIIRIDPSASVDSFFGALLKGSPFHVAVELLSLFALFGGRRHLPLSLLKCRARQAFEVLLTNPIDGGQRYGNSGFTSGAGISMKQNDVKEPTSHASRLVLDCLGYFPSEFYSLAADILLSGLQSVVGYAPSSVLLQCRSKQEHLMLHEIGFSLGIKQWIDDHQKLCPIISDQFSMLIPALPLGSLGSKVEFDYRQQATGKMLHKEIPSAQDNGEYEGGFNLNSSVGLEIDISARDNIQDAPEADEMKDAALVIESIRREEFGLDSDVESCLLKKQHARLGRALHCLSQELYSQDSHFFLELIQNADDNAYSEGVEPTLVFVLQNSRIIVLNNEQGFTAQNIRALCDVGNSTKRGSSSGYIGQKGIGFKSVFRVTNAPEIHSNGFHIKFDISEGQIGFVLPTVVHPCNTDVIRQLESAYSDQMESKSWNTCILLPLRSNLTHGLEMGKIISMFSDIHPSLLLFIHRLQSIKLINMLDNSFVTMRKEIVGDGLVKVTYGENAMTWFIASKKLFPEIIRPGVQVTEISIAITLKECANDSYESHLEQQPVFAFLSLRTYGLKFILQGDFVLPSSREEVDGDSIWNQWLLSEFPDLFVSAEKQFCALPCFRENPGKAVTAYMHCVPLIGEVQGFFSGLPRMIISRLRQSDCLLQEGCDKVWVPPCRVLRNWNEQARMLLPDVLLQEHLGLGFLDKDINLSDQLARALSIQDYGPKVLVQCISSICSAENGLKSMGFRWLSSWLNELHNMLDSERRAFGQASLELDLINNLKKVPCVPLSDGTYVSVNEGTIWLNTNFVSTESDGRTDSISFAKLYASMRIVNPCLFSAASDDGSCMHDNFVKNVVSMLQKIGVQHLTPHEIIKGHILPVISDDKIASQDKALFMECNAFAMLHFQSNCADCRVEKESIISEFQNKALILTNLGFKRLSETAIHFGKEFGSPIDTGKLFCGMDYSWHEIDVLYLKYPLTKSISSGLKKWREFFHSLGVTDFVKVSQVLRNISDISPIRFQQVKWTSDLISSNLPIRDWESQELDCMLSSLARNGAHEGVRSKYLLQLLDFLWDDYFSDKTACYFSCKSDENVPSFKSSLMNNLCDVPWVTSSMDDGLHYPRELFYYCDAVRSILGTSVPYAIPKIRNGKLLTDIGFKTQVTIDDILESLQKWRTLEPFKASVSQMSRLYTFISNESANSKKQTMEALNSGPFIFVPHARGVNPEHDVVGSFFSPDEVYWHDYSGVLDSMKKLISSTPDFPTNKILCDIYPGLQDFFLDDCGVNGTPPFRYYLHILKQLSMNPSPLHAASSVFQVFLRWSDGLRCGSMVDDDILFLREQLLQLDFTVLPTVRDKWVSLHPSFGVICWSDDDSLKNQFMHSENIHFLYFGELTDDEKLMLQTKMSVLMQKLGILALSEIMTREAIFYGPSDISFKASLVDWALPFAQRYIYTVNKEKYAQLKLSEFEKLRSLKIVVVEKLLFRNVVKNCGASSQQQFECSCLLQDDVLYATRESDSHSLFMELSRLFFDGALELHLANFLHMLTTMVESGSTQEQLEFFILNSQKIPRVPDEEPIWSLPSQLASEGNDGAPHADSSLATSNEQNSSEMPSVPEEASCCWPPVGYGLFPTREMMAEEGMAPGEIGEDFVTEEDIVLERLPIYDDFGIPEEQPDPAFEEDRGKLALVCPTNVVFELHNPDWKSNKTNYDSRAPDSQETDFVGRLGEFTAFQHLKNKYKKTLVNWVNEKTETGLPYDIVIGDDRRREYIEVKSTRYASKNWFKISPREWQFAVESGNRYSIARVVLSSQKTAKITVYKNPVRLCQRRQIELGLTVPRKS